MELTWAFLLIILGLALLAAELFFPTGGILFLTAAIAIAAGVVMTFFYGDTATGVLTLIGVFLAGPAVSYAAVQWWPSTKWGQQLQLGADDDATIASMPVNLELEQLRGRFGQAISDLRPSGAVEFDGKRADVLSEGPLIPAGSWVRCIDVRAGRVLVRKVDAPDLDKINLDEVPT